MLTIIKTIFTIKNPKSSQGSDTSYLFSFDNVGVKEVLTEKKKDLVVRINIAEHTYYSLAKPYIKRSEYQRWLLTLKESIRNVCSRLGYESCRNMLTFKRFVLERNGHRMDEYMKVVLSNEDYRYWKSHRII